MLPLSFLLTPPISSPTSPRTISPFSFFFFLMIRPPPRSPLFPSPTLFRSPGTAPEYRQRIFEKFFRGPGRKGEGGGLGLYTPRETVLAHGGDRGVESEHDLPGDVEPEP